MSARKPRNSLSLILLLCCFVGARFGKAAEAPTVAEVVKMLERQEARIETVNIRYTEQRLHDAATFTSVTKMAISRYEKQRGASKFVDSLREDLAAVERHGSKSTTSTRQRLVERQPSGEIRYSITSSLFRPDQGTTVVTRIETYDGERYIDYYPRSAEAFINNTPSVWDISPYQPTFQYGRMPLSRFIRTHNPEVVSTSGSEVVVRCKKIYGVFDQSLYRFTFSWGEHCLLTAMECGSVWGPFRMIQRFPELRWTIEYQESRNGIPFPSRQTFKSFLWLSEGGLRQRGYDRGDMKITTVTDCRLNEPLPKDAFEVHLPPGTKVADRIEGKTYYTPR